MQTATPRSRFLKQALDCYEKGETVALLNVANDFLIEITQDEIAGLCTEDNQILNEMQAHLVDQSGLFSPIDIGPLSDDGQHTVAFRMDDPAGWFCSDPKKIRLHRTRDLLGHTSNTSSSLKATDVQDWLRELASQMRYIIQGSSRRQLWITDEGAEPRYRDDPVGEVEYLARTRFGCEFFLRATHRNE